MISAARGIWFENPTPGGMPIRFDSTSLTLPQFQALLGSKAGANYMGSDPAEAAEVRASA